MFLRWLPVCLISITFLPLQTQAQSDLTQYRDKNRLLLVFALNASDPRLQKQNQLLDRSQAAFRERDLRRFDIWGRSASADHSRARYHIKPSSFRVLLIGKDGHVASSQSTPITLRQITGQIDRMPMRRDEMRRQKENR